MLNKSRPLIGIDGVSSPDVQSGKFGDKFVVLEIAHGGDGFDKQDAKRINAETFIFNPSEIHGGGGTGGGTGSGLGLSLAKTIVEAHGGRLWVKSAGVGRGSVFAMGIPLGSGACEVIDFLPVENHQNVSSSSRRSKKPQRFSNDRSSAKPSLSSGKSSTSARSPFRVLEMSSSHGTPPVSDKMASDVHSGLRSRLLGGPSKSTEETCLSPHLTGPVKASKEISATKLTLSPSPSSILEDANVIALDISNGSKIISATTAEKSTDSSLSGLHALVVEDSKVARTMLVKLLKSLKCTTDEAEDGAVAVKMVSAVINHEADHRNENTEMHNIFDKTDALHALKPPMYDFILCDSVMPVMDGPTAAQNIRAMGYDKPIIGVTGNTLPEQIQDFIAHGADEIVTKPVKLAVLKETIGRRCNVVNFDGLYYPHGDAGPTKDVVKGGGASPSKEKVKTV